MHRQSTESLNALASPLGVEPKLVIARQRILICSLDICSIGAVFHRSLNKSDIGLGNTRALRWDY